MQRTVVRRWPILSHCLPSATQRQQIDVVHCSCQWYDFIYRFFSSHFYNYYAVCVWGRRTCVRDHAHPLTLSSAIQRRDSSPALAHPLTLPSAMQRQQIDVFHCSCQWYDFKYRLFFSTFTIIMPCAFEEGIRVCVIKRVRMFMCVCFAFTCIKLNGALVWTGCAQFWMKPCICLLTFDLLILLSIIC